MCGETLQISKLKMLVSIKHLKGKTKYTFGLQSKTLSFKISNESLFIGRTLFIV